jgi:hypothetical protein
VPTLLDEFQTRSIDAKEGAASKAERSCPITFSTLQLLARTLRAGFVGTFCSSGD